MLKVLMVCVDRRASQVFQSKQLLLLFQEKNVLPTEFTMLGLPVKVYFRVLERRPSRVAAPREEVRLCLGLGHE